MVVGYLVLTTVLGGLLAGKQNTIREFFLAGRKIHWLAVAGSSIATEISAVTLIAVPAVVYRKDGDLTYLHFMLGAVLARLIIAYWFIPAYYEREIYSPYDYMGRRLGPQVRGVTTALFMLGAVLGQSVRVLLTALVLELISGIPLWLSIWLIGAAAVVWTLLGGITTVIWTDVIQFFVFLLGMLAAIGAVLWHVSGGWSEVMRLAGEAGKLKLVNLDPNPATTFTLWSALIGNTLLCLAAYGTDQMMAQRIFCCRGPREARLAVHASNAGLLVAVLAAGVGLALYAYYQHHPMNAAEAALVEAKPDRVFPIFIVRELPPGLTGLIIAGIFAAAISSLDSVLVALAQVVVTGIVRPLREARRRAASLRPFTQAQPHFRGEATPPGGAAAVPYARVAPSNEPGGGELSGERDPSAPDGDDRRDVWLSRLLVVAWAAALCAMAQVAVLAYGRYQNILDLALAMATYTGGPMLAAFVLAFFRFDVDWRGIAWAAPVAILTVFAIQWHEPWAQRATITLALLIVAGWFVDVLRRTSYWATEAWRDLPKTAWLVAFCALAVLLSLITISETPRGQLLGLHGPWNADAALPEKTHFLRVAYPWNVPIGFVVALTLGYTLAGPRRTTAPD